jgi:hypothetical protein
MATLTPDSELRALYAIEAPLWGWPASYDVGASDKGIAQLLRLLYAHPSARKSVRVTPLATVVRSNFVANKKFTRRAVRHAPVADRKKLAANDKDD